MKRMILVDEEDFKELINSYDRRIGTSNEKLEAKYKNRYVECGNMGRAIDVFDKHYHENDWKSEAEKQIEQAILILSKIQEVMCNAKE